MSENKNKINKDANLSQEEKIELCENINRKMEATLNARAVGYEALRILYVNKNNGEMRFIDFEQSIRKKLTECIAETIKLGKKTKEEIVQSLKEQITNPEELAEYLIEKDLRNAYEDDNNVYGVLSEMLPIDDSEIFIDKSKCFVALDWVHKLDSIIDTEILSDADLFVKTMYLMSEKVNSYVSENSSNMSM